MATSQNNPTHLICIHCRHEWSMPGSTIAKSIQCPVCNSPNWAKRALPETDQEKKAKIIRFGNLN